MRVLWKACYLGTLKCKDSPESYILHNINCCYFVKNCWTPVVDPGGGGGAERIISRHDFQIFGSKKKKKKKKKIVLPPPPPPPAKLLFGFLPSNYF